MHCVFSVMIELQIKRIPNLHKHKLSSALKTLDGYQNLVMSFLKYAPFYKTVLQIKVTF